MSHSQHMTLQPGRLPSWKQWRCPTCRISGRSTQPKWALWKHQKTPMHKRRLESLQERLEQQPLLKKRFCVLCGYLGKDMSRHENTRMHQQNLLLREMMPPSAEDLALIAQEEQVVPLTWERAAKEIEAGDEE